MHHWQYLVLFGAILTPVFAIYGSIFPFPPYPANIGVWCTVAGVVISALWTLSSKTKLGLVRTLEPLEA